MAAMREDKYLISFNLLILLALVLQLLSFWGSAPALDMIGTFVIAAIALIGLVIGFWLAQLRNSVFTWGAQADG